MRNYTIMGRSMFLSLCLLISLLDFGQDTKTYVAIATNGEKAIIDGQANEKFWESAQLEGLNKNLVNPEDELTDDYRVSFKVAYDIENLYCIAFVIDDVLVPWTEIGASAWDSDCIEIFINPYSSEETSPVIECHFLAGVNNDEYKEIFSGQLFDWPASSSGFSDYKYFTEETNDGYIVEMQLPWKLIIDNDNPDAPKIGEGTKIPWDINGCDADDPEIRRDFIIGWNADWLNDWMNNSRYGILELGGNNVNGLIDLQIEDVKVVRMTRDIYSCSTKSKKDLIELVTVYNLAGRVIKNQRFNNDNVIIDMGNHQKGLYVLEVKTDMGRYITKINLD